MTSAPRTPTYQLERARLGELSDAELTELERRLGGTEALERALDALASDDAAILEAHPPEAMARAIEGRLRVARARADEDARASRRARWGVGLLVAGLAAILLFILWPGETPPSETPAMNPQPLAQNDLVVEDDDVIRLKGATRLTVFRRGDGGAPERLQPGALVEARDVLQLQYTLNEGRHGVILSIDGRGAVTLHHPARAEGSTALRRGTHALDFSYTLDDAPDFERFFFITADTPISVSPILRRARELAREPARASRAPLNLAAPLRQHSILVRKP